MKQRVLIAGIGLIGGSLLKAIKQSDEYYLIGYDTDNKVLQYVQDEQMTDEVPSDFPTVAAHSDIIILAAPISASIQLLYEIDNIKYYQKVIITDSRKVKGTRYKMTSEIEYDQIVFIGEHPMAGFHKRCIHAAKAHLFENASYVLSQTSQCQQQELQDLKE